jgi:hypothetical protein
VAQDGMEDYLKSEPPSFKQRVKHPKQEAFDLLLLKFQSIFERGYVVSNQSATEIAELEEFIIVVTSATLESPKLTISVWFTMAPAVGSMKPYGHQSFGCLPQNPLLGF